MKDKLVQTIVNGLQEAKARDIQVIDMCKIEEAAFHYFVICEGTSSTHVYGISNILTDYVKDNLGQRDFGHVGMQNRLWVAIDYGYVLVHIFQPETRQFYNLESLWEDANITKIPDLD
ncbi:MAG: ribosome silencing factor [Bacteroidales bacterium]|nr:ribosome silencing factor [Bacteroidales bacterium]